MSSRQRKQVENAWNIPLQSQPAVSGAATIASSQQKKKHQQLTKTSNSIDPNLLIDKKVQNSQQNASMKKFQEAHKKNVEKAKSFVEVCDSSSDEEDDLNTENILENVFKSYAGQNTELIRTQSYLEDVFQSGSAICLVCIGSVKRTDSIWSCSSCYCFFHLLCLQRWANDSLFQQKQRTTEEHGYYTHNGDYVPKKIKQIKWCCPKCRFEYEPSSVPRQYTCFCEKELNPQHHPWLVPHSCGERCNKALLPECGHSCTLLCHPGPCPPCPQFVQTTCRCALSPSKGVRCFRKSWTCGKKCSRILSCGKHICEGICHDENECPPCIKKSKQKCLCGHAISERNCSDSFWQCKKVCNKQFSCGLHKCKNVCHSGVCGECPLGMPRTCPCGKQESIAPCSEIIDTCGDTCQKVLACNEHYCTQRCHKGDCSFCLTIIEKKCRCGLHSKELSCSKLYTCETKCKQLRACKKHVCNRKCCDGNCPPCDKVCGKTLSCHKHKCASVCHDGPCYPCELKSQVKCNCGNTAIVIPCGRERKTRPPKCLKPCRIPSKCHHENSHRCHFDECPKCVKKCGLSNDTTNCSHPCDAKCHAAVKTEIDTSNLTSIWDWPTEMFEYKKLPHPRCEIKVEVSCIGGHERALWPCWNSKPTSCLRTCGRKLQCGNHICQLLCHSVKNLDSQNEQEECQGCEEVCVIERPEGCIHPCKRPCHVPPCLQCLSTTKIYCHCGLTQVYYKCSEYNDSGLSSNELDEKREKLKSCGNRCMKNYPCGHRCAAICHSGKCPNAAECRKKLKIYCKCKNIKKEIVCEKYRNGFTEIQCDETCITKRELEVKSLNEKEEKQRKIEQERNRLELEQFEKKFSKKKYRERKPLQTDDKNVNYLKLWIGFGIIGALLAIVLGYYFTNF